MEQNLLNIRIAGFQIKQHIKFWLIAQVIILVFFIVAWFLPNWASQGNGQNGNLQVNGFSYSYGEWISGVYSVTNSKNNKLEDVSISQIQIEWCQAEEDLQKTDNKIENFVKSQCELWTSMKKGMIGYSVFQVVGFLSFILQIYCTYKVYSQKKQDLSQIVLVSIIVVCLYFSGFITWVGFVQGTFDGECKELSQNEKKGSICYETGPILTIIIFGMMFILSIMHTIVYFLLKHHTLQKSLSFQYQEQCQDDKKGQEVSQSSTFVEKKSSNSEKGFHEVRMRFSKLINSIRSNEDEQCPFDQAQQSELTSPVNQMTRQWSNSVQDRIDSDSEELKADKNQKQSNSLLPQFCGLLGITSQAELKIQKETKAQKIEKKEIQMPQPKYFTQLNQITQTQSGSNLKRILQKSGFSEWLKKDIQEKVQMMRITNGDLIFDSLKKGKQGRPNAYEEPSSISSESENSVEDLEQGSPTC